MEKIRQSQVPVKRKRIDIEKKDPAVEYILHNHYCTASQLEVIVGWLCGIPTSRHLAKKLQETQVVFPNKKVLFEYPMSDQPTVFSWEGSSTTGSKRKRQKPLPNSAAETSATTRTTSRAPIKTLAYQKNLEQNKIIYESNFNRKLPEDVAAACNIISNSLASGNGQNIVLKLERLIKIQHVGAPTEAKLIDELRKIFLPEAESPLTAMRVEKFLAALVPKVSERDKVVIPWPDLVYAYDVDTAFTSEQRGIINGDPYLHITTAEQGTFPFLIVEFKGNDPIWHASNQCLGGTAACINLTDLLNRELERLGAAIQTTVFSIAANAYEGVLHVSWAEDGHYIMKDLDYFHFRRSDELLRMKAVVESILEWGKNQRLNEIRTALDLLAS
ncbi:hypothetical protein F4821DRAFT_255953 [Hypoxylon rubiginosum]|uniref:Uncharacterized protein n=1 Tax=Hypoxylon rubiginosum TaxID=110542 RepID=A0ACC0DDS1_9PEZI|nr:hypothetical protein F4821DRAFT_255953 [Hypoxylon rubiginosum]